MSALAWAALLVASGLLLAGLFRRGGGRQWASPGRTHDDAGGAATYTEGG